MSTAAAPTAVPADRSRPAGLLERDGELALLDDALRGALRGTGRALLLEGQAGIGKSTLLTQARLRATDLGFRLASARGAVLERDLSHGVARQLLEPFVAAADPARRATLLSGAAALAAPVVSAADPTPDGSADQRAPVVHGLYWLTAALAGEQPLLLTVDDLQWCDAASLRFLDYLARRLDGLPVVLLMAVRQGEGGTPVLDELRAAPGLRAVRPSALSGDAVRQLVRALLTGDPSPEFVEACRQATGGLPYLVGELLTTLAGAGVAPDARSAAAVSRVTSSTVGHATLIRLSRLSPDAVQVAQCVAVLGRHATPRRVARLGGLDDAAVLLCVDTLVAARILRDTRPLEFAHPIVLGSVYGEIGSGVRSLAHARAAAQLAADGEDPEEVASHLLRTEPGGGQADALLDAANQALHRGAPESAISYLRRYLLDPHPVGDRAAALRDLGRAESIVRDENAAPDLRQAISLTADPAERGLIAVDLVQSLMFGGRWTAALATVDQSLRDLADADPETAAHLEVFRAGMMSNEPTLVDRFEADRPRLLRLAAGPGRSARLMAALLASSAACRSEPAGEVLQLCRHGLAGDVLMTGPDADAWGPQAAGALAYLGRWDEAMEAATIMLTSARRRGSVYGFVRASGLRALVNGKRGDLLAVEADLRAAFELARGHQLAFSMPPLLIWSVDALVERPGLADIAAAALSVDLDPGLHGSFSGAWLLEVRGRLLAQSGRIGEACADLRRSGELMERLHTRHPEITGWRQALALALPESDRAEAIGLAAEALEHARATGQRRTIGVALRTVGRLATGATALEHLSRSAELLESSPLELARTRLTHGRALRRDGRRTAADPELRAALDLAHRCGAERLADLAQQELVAIGARPRRRASIGIDALTPSEARVARQAASGMTNRDIAQALFVTTKTVENQLGRVYLKLGVRRREELAELLG